MTHETVAGRLLVATPLLRDPNFDRTVVFVCFHDEAGAFGLVLNRAMGAPAASLVPGWDELISPPAELHAGGPVERQSVLGLARMDCPEDARPEWWTDLGNGLGLLNLAANPEEAEDIEALRIFHGYAGWGAAQLDVEIGEQAWWVVDATPEDLFTEDPARLWNTVLRRQRTDLALYATYPAVRRSN